MVPHRSLVKRLEAAQDGVQTRRVARGEHLPVVVEVGEDVGLARPAVQAPRPLLQLGLGVVAPAPAPPVVEADDGEVGRQLVRLPGAVGAVADDQRDAVPAQRVEDLRDEPARVAELEGMPAGRQVVQGVGQARVVAAEVGGQLPEDGPHLRALHQRLEALVQPLHALLHVGQPPDVGEVAAGFDGEQEVRGRALHPRGHRLALGQPVEGVVELDGVEDRRVVLQPPALRTALRVEVVLPGAVDPARAADAQRCHQVLGLPSRADAGPPRSSGPLTAHPRRAAAAPRARPGARARAPARGRARARAGARGAAGAGARPCVSGEAPDYVEAVVGYRAWHVAGDGLLRPWTFTALPWSPGVNSAVCARDDRHAPPVGDCMCGLYALTDPADRRLDFRADQAVGAIAAWGDLEVHRTGFRAQEACIVALALPARIGVEGRDRLERAAARYGVPLVPATRLSTEALRHGAPL